MSEHTQGKLSVRAVKYPLGDTGDYDGAWLVEAGGGARVIEIFDCNGSGYSDVDEQNIRRIVAAWNACQGIPTEALEARANGGPLWGLDEQLRATDQISELVRAMRGVIRVADRATEEFDAARAAIARATGEKA